MLDASRAAADMVPTGQRRRRPMDEDIAPIVFSRAAEVSYVANCGV